MSKAFLSMLALFSMLTGGLQRGSAGSTQGLMFDKASTISRLQSHLKVLTEEIGERSVAVPENLFKTQAYIESFYRRNGIPSASETYAYRNMEVANVTAELAWTEAPNKRYVLGAHYDSVQGTVGADDNASAVAVQLETARQLSRLDMQQLPKASVVFVSFALEEPPVYGTRFMGSRVYARKAKSENQQIDGMICLEMVGYTCHTPGCQQYPFPLMFMNYPSTGNFIGIVGNFGSRRFGKSLAASFERNPALPVVRLTVPFGGRLLPSVRLSDHASFWDQGYRAVMVTDSAFYRNPHYHLPSDRYETLDFGFMAALVKSLVLFFTSQE